MFGILGELEEKGRGVGTRGGRYGVSHTLNGVRGQEREKIDMRIDIAIVGDEILATTTAGALNESRPDLSVAVIGSAEHRERYAVQC